MAPTDLPLFELASNNCEVCKSLRPHGFAMPHADTLRLALHLFGAHGKDWQSAQAQARVMLESSNHAH